ncbi:phage holin family protein [Oxalobacter sp. OttesenSCG-928-P03]|nr:phage holin family protein [Oxalobacter sp. OttesenSCG-928-P03]
MGILRNVTRMASTLLAIFHTRVELFSVELQEEAQRLLSYLILSLIALFCVMMTFLLTIFLVIVLFWDSWRILAISGLIACFAGAAILIWLGIRSSYRKKPRMLAYTRSEIARDIERLKSGGQAEK